MSQKNDQVFQLSLTEIAFTIAFILLLLLGYLVAKEQAERKALEETLSHVTSLNDATKRLNAAEESFKSSLAEQGATNVEDIITRLVEAEALREERDRLKRRLEDLDKKLTALTELRAEIENASKSKASNITREVIEDALSLRAQVLKAVNEANASSIATSQISESSSEVLDAGVSLNVTDPDSDARAIEFVIQAIAATNELQNQLREQMNLDLKNGDESEIVKGIVLAAKKYTEQAAAGNSKEQVQKENADLRGQVAFLKNKLDARGGRDYPPCWANEHTGKVEFLFAVDMQPGSVEIRSAWPKERETDAAALPGVMEMISDSPIKNSDFMTRVKGVFDISQKMQCRHYVLLKSLINDAVESDRARLMVENYFYKMEVRR